MVCAPAVVAEDAPVLEASKNMLDPSAKASMTTPGAIANDSISMKDGDAKAVNPTIPAVGEDVTMLEAKRLDERAPVMKGVVTVSGSPGRGCDDAAVAPADQDLSIARPTIVLGFGGSGMVAGGNQGSVDDPGLPSIRAMGRASKVGQDRGKGSNDAVDRRFREAGYGCELADGEVGT